MTATDQTTAPLDLAPIRERLARYEAMGDKLDDGKLPDLSRSATATAIGLAASFVAAYVPHLLAEVERLRGLVKALREVAEAMAQGATPDQIMTEEWDGLPCFDSNGRWIDR